MALILQSLSRTRGALCKTPLHMLLRDVPLQCTRRSVYCLQRHEVCGFGHARHIFVEASVVACPRRVFVVQSCSSKFCTKPDGKDISREEPKADNFLHEEPPQKLNIFQRYKKMFKEYWYVMLPVHVATSIVWFGSFFYLATCGVDVVPLLEFAGLPESVISPLRKSGLGYIAAASAMYKLATPARYAVTLGGTSVAIRQLVKRGLIKPMPSGDQLRQMFRDKMKPQ